MIDFLSGHILAVNGKSLTLTAVFIPPVHESLLKPKHLKLNNWCPEGQNRLSIYELFSSTMVVA